MQSRRQEQPTFEPGDRFRLTKTIHALDITDERRDFWEDFPSSLKGQVEEADGWEIDLETGEETFCFTLRFDAFPQRKIFYIAEDDHGGPFEQVAAKSINLN